MRQSLRGDLRQGVVQIERLGREGGDGFVATAVRGGPG
jgi:hypothetical protein